MVTSRVLAALFGALMFSMLAVAESPTPWRIVNFWSEWCAPCREELPMLNELSRRLASSGIEVVGINYDDNPRDATLAIAQRLGIEFPTLERNEVAAMALRPPEAMPTTLILRPDGSVAVRLVGMQDRDTILRHLVDLELISPSPSNPEL